MKSRFDTEEDTSLPGDFNWNADDMTGLFMIEMDRGYYITRGLYREVKKGGTKIEIMKRALEKLEITTQELNYFVYISGCTLTLLSNRADKARKELIEGLED